MKLTRNEVAIWRIHLAKNGTADLGLGHLLSDDELERADRFLCEADRRRFVIARAAMRRILGRYCGSTPRQLVFSHGPKGKPKLCGVPHPCNVKFNLSHSLDAAILAVTLGLEIGADIESTRSDFPVEEIAAHFFSRDEIEALRTVTARERTEAFFSCWTRKEAYVKALGEGLSTPPDSFSVPFGSKAPATLLRAGTDAVETSGWSTYEVEAGEAYKAAVVVEGRGHHLQYLDYPANL